jgi:hypothetical protein
MKKILLFSLFSAIMLSSCVSLSSCRKYPEIAFSEEEFDFGLISPGSEVKHVFSFINRGGAPLVIRRVKAG